ncbi:MAG TPA: HU family DNA-binding protein [Mycobacteriales bacterium]|nr:HU family DNA-binding protein [Mycobacteriales bacterium]
MNKSELIEAVGDELGSRAVAVKAVDAVLNSIMTSVASGERVGIVGFGTFEKRERSARTARNIRTGATIKVKATSVPGFRAGAGFKEMVAGGGKRKAATKKTAAAKPAAKKTAAKATAAKSGVKKTAAKVTAKKAAPKKAGKKK